MKLYRHKQKQTGVTLIEVLIALVILSVGLLGVSVMLVQGIRFNHDSNIRTQALFLASDMADRIRVNRGSADLYGTITGTEADPGCIHAAGGCTAEELAQSDGFEWGQLIANTLPGGSGTVVPAAVAGMFTITVNWVEQNKDAATGVVNKSFVLTILP